MFEQIRRAFVLISFHRTLVSLDFVEFPYERFEGRSGKVVHRPCLPITFSYRGKSISIGSALVDTGSDFTILPLEIAHVLEIELDDSQTIRVDCAGGGVFTAMPSQNKIGYLISVKGYRPIAWTGTVFFAENEPIILLGHHECLEKFDLTFQGPEKSLGLLPRCNEMVQTRR